LFLLTFRFFQAAWRVVTGEIDSIISGHEAEELVEEAAAKADKED
jgi:C4-dicarboxylate transporter DctQ subunit